MSNELLYDKLEDWESSLGYDLDIEFYKYNIENGKLSEEDRKEMEHFFILLYLDVVAVDDNNDNLGYLKIRFNI